jgi:hypothetical protein
MSKRVRLAMAAITSLSLLAGCAGQKPVFHECGGNNCRNQARESDEVVSAPSSQPTHWLAIA